jgi:hypothetical protein
MTTQADGRAERDAALLMLHELSWGRSGRITTGADKAYDTRDFVSTLRELGVTPHVARRQNGAIDERTSRHPGYVVSLSKRWLVEKPFGWLKQVEKVKPARSGEGGLVVRVQLRGLQPDPYPETASAERMKPPIQPSAPWPSGEHRKLK